MILNIERLGFYLEKYTCSTHLTGLKVTQNVKTPLNCSCIEVFQPLYLYLYKKWPTKLCIWFVDWVSSVLSTSLQTSKHIHELKPRGAISHSKCHVIYKQNWLQDEMNQHLGGWPPLLNNFLGWGAEHSQRYCGDWGVSKSGTERSESARMSITMISVQWNMTQQKIAAAIKHIFHMV